MELTDNQETKTELVINFLLFETDKSCLSFSIQQQKLLVLIFLKAFDYKGYSVSIDHICI